MTGAALKMTGGNEISKQPLLSVLRLCVLSAHSQCENVIKIAFSSDTQAAAEILLTASAHSLAVRLHGSSSRAWMRIFVQYRQLLQIVEISNLLQYVVSL